MDQKTMNVIAKYLLTKPDLNSAYAGNFMKQFPDLSADIINAALIALETEGVVWLTMGGGEIVYASITPAAHGYLRRIEEEAAKRRGERLWELFKITYQSIFGFVLGIAATLIAQKLLGICK